MAEPCFAGKGLKINVIDLGEGDAILLQAEGRSALIDSGGLLSGYQLVNFLKDNNVSRLDYLILTHPDPDHIGGAFFIVPEFEISRVFDNGQDLGDEDIARWYARLVRSQGNYRALKAGDALRLGGAVLEVLWPDKADTAGGYNADSLVIMLKYASFRCLFTGDLNNAGEKILLEKERDLKADVLKVGHHGYLDATSPEFLAAVSPEYAVISVDARQRKGMPSQQTLDLLKGKNIKTCRTDKGGTIAISVGKNGRFSVTTQR